ncbi:MAG: hypothetical protein A4E72_00819 [Syntrophus sp. PtaU1.Bin208]|nr:MAG: hypothetical protein A4E72_00819 [Syntrophus sp. PtaU1.Bin208]
MTVAGMKNIHRKILVARNPFRQLISHKQDEKIGELIPVQRQGRPVPIGKRMVIDHDIHHQIGESPFRQSNSGNDGMIDSKEPVFLLELQGARIPLRPIGPL